MQKILTKRKQAWVDQRKPKMVQGTAINVNAAVEDRYYRNLASLINSMAQEVEKKVKGLFSSETAEQYFAQDATISPQARILTNAFFKKFESIFAEKAVPLSESFADQSESASKSQVKGSLKDLSGGLTISLESIDEHTKEILKATITENVGLIKSIPQQYLTQVQGAVMRSITQGNGLQDLIPYLQYQHAVTLRRARMIAKDQTRKAMNNLSRGRLQELGVEDYEWIHTGGSAHPREDHIALSGKVFSWTDPSRFPKNKKGEAITPGSEINCRCRFRPVIKFD